MPRFHYKAKTSSDDSVEGVLEADTAGAAVRQLGAMGRFPILLEKEQAVGSVLGAARPAVKIPIDQMSICLRQLSDLLEAGLPLTSALAMAADQSAHKDLKLVLTEMAAAVRQGRTLSQSMSAFPDVFAPFAVHLVGAGETGGMLGKVLSRLADSSEKEDEVKSQILGALAYPGFILLVGIVTVCFMLGFVIPRLSELFTDFSRSLPLPTRALIFLSGFVRRNAWAPIAALVGGYFLWKRFALPEKWLLRRDRVLLRVPAVGSWIVSHELSQFSRTLGSLLENGVAILSALAVTEKTMGNRVFRQAVAALAEPVRRGVPFSRALRGQTLFPAYVCNLIAVGEEGGAVDKSLLKIADSSEKRAQRALKVAMSLLEPTLILLVGALLGGVVISIMLPIFEINTLVH